MKEVKTLRQLLETDERSRALFDSLPVERQVALQETRQNICTHEALERYVKAAQN